MKHILLLMAGLLALIANPAQAQNTSAVLAPIVSLLLEETPLNFPVSWNNSRVIDGQRISANEGSVNLVSIDYTQLPISFNQRPESLSFDVSGACYQLFSGSNDQTLFEFNVVATVPGICTLHLQIDGASLVLAEVIDVVVKSSPQTNNIAQIIAKADTTSGEAVVQGEFSFTNIRKWISDDSLSSHPGAVFSDENRPNMFEFRATYQGVPLKGVMLTTTRKLDVRNFSNLDVDSRTHVRFVNNQPALVGSGKVTGSAGNTNTFAFIATGVNTTLVGPAEGKEFHVGGKNRLNALCVDERIVGFSLFSNERTLSRISTSLVGFTNKDCTTSNNRFQGTTGVYADFQSVNTHIGTILRGRGTAHPLKGGRINTVDDQDENDPDYALYFLGLPERVSVAHEIVPLNNSSVLRDKVRVFDPFAIAKIAKIRRESGTMIFKEPPEMLAGVAVGDIIVGKPSARLRDGFFREVTARGQQNGQFFLQTKPAKLDQLLQQGGFDIGTRELLFEDLDEIVTPEYYSPDVTQANRGSVTLGHAKTRESYQDLKTQQRNLFGESGSSAIKQKGFLSLPLPNVSFDHVFVDADNNFNTTNDQWRTEGRFELGASVVANFRCNGFPCQNPSFLLKFEFTEDFELSGHIFTDFNDSIYGKHTITSMKFGRIWIGPVSIRPQIDLNVILNGETNTDVEFGVDQFFSAELGIELENGTWDTINNQSFGISASPTPDFQPNDGKADVRARAALEGSVKLSGIRVGGVDAGIYTDLDADTPRDPIWEVTAGLNSEAYIEIDLLLTTIEGGPFELFDIPFNIEGGEAPNFPPSITGIRVEGIEVVDGVAARTETVVETNAFSASPENPLNVKVQVFDPEIGYNCCTVTLTDLNTGEVLGTKTPSDVTDFNNYKFDITELSDGPQRFEVRAVPQGASVSSALVEEFRFRSFDFDSNLIDCEAVELRTAVDREVDITVTAPESILLQARLSEGCLLNVGNDVAFFESAQGRSSLTPFLTIATSDEDGKSIAYASAFFDDTKVGTREFVAKYTDRRGDIITSNPVVVNVESLVPEIIGDLGTPSNVDLVGTNTNEGFTGCYGGQCPTAGQIGVGLALKRTKTLNSEEGGPVAIPVPSITTPRRVRLDNWSAGETVFFKNPFPELANYRVLWSIDDDAATAITDLDGNGQITSSTPGWHRVTVSYTHESEPQANRRFIKNQIFYISPNSNNKWRGYEQETIDDDATRLELMSGTMGTTPI